MKYAHAYLVRTGKTKNTTRESFIRELSDKWFKLYSRKARNDSSGFEHVFIGEIKEETHEIVGFHNWIRLYLEERKGALNYLGYIKPKRRALDPSIHGPANEQLITMIQFEWKVARKPVSSSLVGTSPEFEIALYTMCFMAGQHNVANVLQLGPYQVGITCHTWPLNLHPGQPHLFIDHGTYSNYMLLNFLAGS